MASLGQQTRCNAARLSVLGFNFNLALHKEHATISWWPCLAAGYNAVWPSSFGSAKERSLDRIEKSTFIEAAFTTGAARCNGVYPARSLVLGTCSLLRSLYIVTVILSVKVARCRRVRPFLYLTVVLAPSFAKRSTISSCAPYAAQ